MTRDEAEKHIEDSQIYVGDFDLSEADPSVIVDGWMTRADAVALLALFPTPTTAESTPMSDPIQTTPADAVAPAIPVDLAALADGLLQPIAAHYSKFNDWDALALQSNFDEEWAKLMALVHDSLLRAAQFQPTRVADGPGEPELLRRAYNLILSTDSFGQQELARETLLSEIRTELSQPKAPPEVVTVVNNAAPGPTLEESKRIARWFDVYTTFTARCKPELDERDPEGDALLGIKSMIVFQKDLQTSCNQLTSDMHAIFEALAAARPEWRKDGGTRQPLSQRAAEAIRLLGVEARKQDPNLAADRDTYKRMAHEWLKRWGRLCLMTSRAFPDAVPSGKDSTEEIIDRINTALLHYIDCPPPPPPKEDDEFLEELAAELDEPDFIGELKEGASVRRLRKIAERLKQQRTGTPTDTTAELRKMYSNAPDEGSTT